MKIRASECIEVEVTSRATEKSFLEENHLQGYVPSIICYGLIYNGELVMMMSFGKPRYNKKYGWELLRMCSKKDYCVHGGASKLLKAFCRNNDISEGILSYCNRDYFSGDVYRALGFTSHGITRGYHYEKDGNKFHRTAFTRKRCLERWPQYNNTELTERQIMEKEGYTRVEDRIGQELFILNDFASYYVYKITFTDGSTYIGSHVEYQDNDGYVTSSAYAQDHGIKKREILFKCNDRFQMNFLESWEIMEDKAYSPHNVNGNLGNFVFTHPIAISLRRDWTWSDKQRERFSMTMKGHQVTEATRKKISMANKGRKHSEEAKKKMSLAHKGHSSSMKGRKHSEETKKKLSLANKGRKHSEETKKKISAGAHHVFVRNLVTSEVTTTQELSLIAWGNPLWSGKVKQIIIKKGVFKGIPYSLENSSSSSSSSSYYC